MKIHEYQAKEILRRFGVAVPRGKLATSPEQAVAAARELMTDKGVCVVKAQIHAGGRGKGGGVKLARSPEQAGELARAMLGMQLVTHQTGPQGQKVRKVYVEEGMDIARELYLGLTLDRAIARNVLMASSEGGVEIEEVAARHPEKILRGELVREVRRRHVPRVHRDRRLDRRDQSARRDQAGGGPGARREGELR